MKIFGADRCFLLLPEAKTLTASKKSDGKSDGICEIVCEHADNADLTDLRR